MPHLPLFVFGTLRRGQCNHRLLQGNYSRVSVARLPGFKRVNPLMIAPSPTESVDGELFFLHSGTYARTLAACDELEGLPPGKLVGPYYRRIAVTVEADGGSFEAWAYVHPRTESA